MGSWSCRKLKCKSRKAETHISIVKTKDTGILCWKYMQSIQEIKLEPWWSNSVFHWKEYMGNFLREVIPGTTLSVVLAAEWKITMQARFKSGPRTKLSIVRVSQNISLATVLYGTQFYAPKLLCSAGEQ